MQVDSPQAPDWFALAAAVVTAVLMLIVQVQTPNPFFIAGVCLFWIGYVVFRARKNKSVFREWGFRTENLWPTAAIAFALFVAIASSFAVFALVRGTFAFPVHTLLLLLLYPIWGLIQQFLDLAIVVRNLALIPFLGDHKALLVLLGAMLFAVAHVNDPREMTGTFLLELAIIPIYLQYRNLWPLGVLHGWVGGLFYLWVLDRDMWAALFGPG